MLRLWGAEHRAHLWRRLWLTLAEEQRRLGVAIPDAAIEAMRRNLDRVDLQAVRRHEQRVRHDVVAHIHAFGHDAPPARPFLHLGATSAYVTDNADLIVFREAMRLLLGRVAAVLGGLRTVALEHRAVPTLAYTHFQPAQLTTVGKRASLWLYDFALDAQALRNAIATLPFRGCKGTTGTQASYLQLFDGDHEKVRELDRRVAAAWGFESVVPVSGQTYSRKLDSGVLDVLAGLAQSGSKFGTDLRLLQHEGEILEPFEQEQVGSSAMPYKRNPVRAERVCALSRYLIALRDNGAYTAATQWLERSLDDSANRRLVFPEAFLTADAILILCTNISVGLDVQPAAIRRHVEAQMPFMAAERWLLLGVAAGGDRQELHEVMRRHSQATKMAMAEGAQNDLLDRLSAEPAFARVDRQTMKAELDAGQYIGRAPDQVLEFVEGTVDPLLASLKSYSVSDAAKVTL